MCVGDSVGVALGLSSERIEGRGKKRGLLVFSPRMAGSGGGARWGHLWFFFFFFFRLASSS